MLLIDLFLRELMYFRVFAIYYACRLAVGDNAYNGQQYVCMQTDIQRDPPGYSEVKTLHCIKLLCGSEFLCMIILCLAKRCNVLFDAGEGKTFARVFVTTY